MPPTTAICAALIVFCLVRAILRRVSCVLDNIPGPARKSLLTGNVTQYHDPDGWEFHQELEEKYGQVVKVHGLIGDRHLFVFDPAALHSILVKDQDLYEEMPKFIGMNALLFGKGISSAIRDEHRKYRKIMMPAFSTANLRALVPLFYEVAERARDGLISPYVLHGPQTLDFNSVLCRTSLELIGHTGIGYSFDPMIPGQEQTDRYGQSLRALTSTAFELSLAIPLIPFILKIPFPSFLRFMIKLIPSPALHKLRDLVDFTNATATQLVRDREVAIKNGELDVKHDAKDLMSLLMKNNMSTEGQMHLSDDELVACTSMIIHAATDTTSSAMSRFLHILAMHPDVQEKLRAEILAASDHLDHDTLVALPYLDSVVREILRLYPTTSPGMYREACEDTVLPLNTPITGVDGTVMNTIHVPKGTSIYIAIAAANHNKQIWGEDTLEFRPERWTNGKAESVTVKLCGVYGNTMTFLGGGRSCIGFKFALLEMKIVMCVLLRAFRFSEPDPRIKWRMTGVVPSPTVDNQPSLPIRIEHLNAL
ncbi:cytochrome P450 [Mycena sp. CBHHK59/15]|nr:cytochrome P450 [Mycena sp. CBHHK59/15]